jgi:hypothetical protein
VQAYLAQLKIAEFGVSRAALVRELQFAQGAQKQGALPCLSMALVDF